MNTKRIFDVSLSFLGLVVLVPVLLIAALAVRIESPGPVFFRQERIGHLGRPFHILKFRTMRANAAQEGPLVTTNADTRITRVGKVLRKSKLDELPQLLNVVRGEMSLVGPRPEVPKFMGQYTAEQRTIILSVKPGITDFSAIEFRNEEELLSSSKDPERTYVKTIMPKKFLFYKKYVDEQTLWLDVKLIYLTIFNLLTNASARRPSDGK